MINLSADTNTHAAMEVPHQPGGKAFIESIDAGF